jgi:hypothetical protein
MTSPQRTVGRMGAGIAWRRLGLVLLAAALGGIVAHPLVSGRFVPGQWPVWVAGGGALVLLAGALSWWIWRCPQCKGHLGDQWFAKQCPHCGVELRRPNSSAG